MHHTGRTPPEGVEVNEDDEVANEESKPPPVPSGSAILTPSSVMPEVLKALHLLC